MFHLRFGLSDHLKALLDFVFGSRRRVKKVRIFRAWFSQKGPWPRHGHASALLRQYQARSPRIVAWARATFEQGALPSLQGLVPIFTLQEIRCFKLLD